ncbi:MAG: helix-turn-helix domain-containing protein [Dermatophilaceae bacterium]
MTAAPPTVRPGGEFRSTEEVIDLITEPIQQYTRGWMLDPSTNDYGVSLGFETGAQFWVVGRAGVLGSCPAEIAAAAIAFEALPVVRGAWDAVPTGLTHREVATHYCAQPVAWAERAFADLDDDTVTRVDALGSRVVAAAPASLGVLFAGWRLLPRPSSLRGRVGLTIHLLRELRGAAHICAISACGLTPLDAVLAAPHPPPRTGPAYAERMGWVGPFRNPAEIRDARLRAEQLTTTILAPFYDVLSPNELEDLSSSLVHLCTHGLGGARP